MADPNASVFDMSNFIVTRRVASNYKDDIKIPIDRGVASGQRITLPGFLAGIKPGQDQILIHTDDQSIHIDKTQWVRITEKRDTEVGQDELYVNKQKYDHQVIGPYVHKYHNTTREEYVLDTNIDYYQHIRQKEHVGDTRIRNIQDTTIIHGSEFTMATGTRTRLMWGVDTTLTAPIRMTGIGGLELKAALVDSAFSLAKDSSCLIEGKANIVQSQIGCGKTDVRLVNFAPFGFLVRAGIFCAKGVAAAVGSIRW
jgi:hypothetical protein